MTVNTKTIKKLEKMDTVELLEGVLMYCVSIIFKYRVFLLITALVLSWTYFVTKFS